MCEKRIPCLIDGHKRKNLYVVFEKLLKKRERYAILNIHGKIGESYVTCGRV